MNVEKWFSIKNRPKKGIRVLACDEFGYVTLQYTDDIDTVQTGKMNWTQDWKYGNGTRIVAWMYIPDWPKKLCRKDADGKRP